MQGSQTASVDLDRVAQHVCGCVARFPAVAGAYLYGSVLARMHPASDIDVAVIVAPGLHTELLQVLTLEAEIESKLGRWEGRPFHVTALDPKRPLFSFRPIHEGRLVYIGDEKALTDFIEQVSRAYADLSPRYRRAVQEVLER
ncbi:MAG: nucleotidyltransferase domain-containing protein [Bacillota bacterium]